ncbi:hypothetical protein [Ureibacillus chungkukjangi]
MSTINTFLFASRALVVDEFLLVFVFASVTGVMGALEEDRI